MVIAEFVDGTRVEFTDSKPPYSVFVNGKFETRFETEIDAVQYLLKAGYYKGDPKKALLTDWTRGNK